MSVAVLTYVYNEKVNLPIWIKYYGDNFGAANLFVVDRESNDGSTDDIAPVNRIVLPRTEFNEFRKTGFMQCLHQAMLHEYDTVIYTDCDELIVPDLSMHANLRDYVARTDFDYLTCLGMDILHIINREPPIDLTRPILAQRQFARLKAASCKTLMSRVPLRWLPGFHSCDKPPRLDGSLFLYHTKFMDFGHAMLRQQINQETAWAEESLKLNHGVHHRYDFERFVREGFLDPLHQLNKMSSTPPDLRDIVARVAAETEERGGFYHLPIGIAGMLALPAAQRQAF